MAPDPIAEGWFDAHVFLQRFAVRSRADIRPEAWAHSYGIEIVEAELDGAAAQLVRLGDRARIVLPSKMKDNGARRFSIMHELDHFLKQHPSPSPTMMCTPKHARRCDDAGHAHEMHANAYSGAALLPHYLLRKYCEVSPVSLNVPWWMAKEYDVSILTSTIRFTELSSERCAAVFSRRGAIEWVVRSSTCTREIQRGKRLDRTSVAWDFYMTGKLDDREQLVPASAWFDTRKDVEIIEHSTCSPKHGTVLSLLWVPDAVGPALGMG